MVRFWSVENSKQSALVQTSFCQLDICGIGDIFWYRCSLYPDHNKQQHSLLAYSFTTILLPDFLHHPLRKLFRSSKLILFDRRRQMNGRNNNHNLWTWGKPVPQPPFPVHNSTFCFRSVPNNGQKNIHESRPLLFLPTPTSTILWNSSKWHPHHAVVETSHEIEMRGVFARSCKSANTRHETTLV